MRPYNHPELTVLITVLCSSDPSRLGRLRVGPVDRDPMSAPHVWLSCSTGAGWGPGFPSPGPLEGLLGLPRSMESCSQKDYSKLLQAGTSTAPTGHVVTEPPYSREGHTHHLLMGTCVKESVAILKLPHLKNVFGYFVVVVNTSMQVLCGYIYLKHFSEVEVFREMSRHPPSPSTRARPLPRWKPLTLWWVLF